VKNPAAETAGRLKLNICFQCHSRLSGHLRRLAEARILPTCSGSQERFSVRVDSDWTSQNDRNKELRQRPQGVKFMKYYKKLLTSSDT
jgi:hypothetical protein